MSKPLAVVIGAVGKLPYAGVGVFYLHHVAGLLKLGYDVHYVERQNWSGECYDAENDRMTDDPLCAVEHLNDILPRFGVATDRYSFIDLAGRCFGSGWNGLLSALDRADFVLTVGNPTWFDELERCPRRLYIESDPMFTQVAMVTGTGSRAEPPKHYDPLFTHGPRIGKPDCRVPTAGREWIAAGPMVDTTLWAATAGSPSLPVTGLLHWAAGDDLEFGGEVYGHKNREFEKFIDLPQRTTGAFRVAIGGGGVPWRRLSDSGWDLVSPLHHTRTLENYQAFISDSSADLGIAKHAYVASRCGWFSDRSTCFLASGRPVLHQDTGCGDWVPVGEGILLFHDMNSLLAALDSLNTHYERHARAARELAVEYFEASKVLGKMLHAAGVR